jgi:hypothetical protein
VHFHAGVLGSEGAGCQGVTGAAFESWCEVGGVRAGCELSGIKSSPFCVGGIVPNPLRTVHSNILLLLWFFDSLLLWDECERCIGELMPLALWVQRIKEAEEQRI